MAERKETMKKEFLKKVITYGSVDTQKYRYVLDGVDGWIVRLSIDALGSTAAFNGWEKVIHSSEV